jgi:hypothetical protein
MADEAFMFAKCAETLRGYEERAERERLAAAGAAKPELASAHRLLAIQYEADADELRRQLAAKV